MITKFDCAAEIEAAKAAEWTKGRKGRGAPLLRPTPFDGYRSETEVNREMERRIALHRAKRPVSSP